MKIILCNPIQEYYSERWKNKSISSLGLLYIAAVLEKNNIDVKILDLNLYRMIEPEIVQFISEENPNIIGITTLTENRFNTFYLAKKIKHIFPQIIIVIGGPHCTLTDYDTLSNIPEIDIVVRGEGEETFLELVKTIKNKGELEKVKGISFRTSSGVIIQNPNRKLIDNLDELPMPARHLIDFKKYNFKMNVADRGELNAAIMITSRGCPFNCNFCSTPVNWGKYVRGLSPENVLKEIQFLIEVYDTKVIWFFDDTFNYDIKRLELICELIIKKKLNIYWFAEIRVDLITKQTFELMVSAGLYNVAFGVETAVPRIANKIINKKINLEQVRNVINWSNEYKITVTPFFIFSHPTETFDEANETLKFAKSLARNVDCNMSILHIYPGSELYNRAVCEGKIPSDFSWTKPNNNMIIEIPAGQGNVPLYRDKLTLYQIAKIIFEFNEYFKKITLKSRVIKSIKKFLKLKNFKIYFIMLSAYIVVKSKNFFLKYKIFR